MWLLSNGWKFWLCSSVGRHLVILKRGVTQLDWFSGGSGDLMYLSGNCVGVLASLLLAMRSTWAAPSLFEEIKESKEFAGERKQHPSNIASPLAGQQYSPDYCWNYPLS